MEIRQLSSKIIRRSENFAEVMSVCSTLLKYNDNASKVLNYVKTRVPPEGVGGFSVGYWPRNEEISMLFEFIDPSVLEDLGIVYKRIVHDSGHAEQVYCGVLNNHPLIMPYKNTYGDIIGLVGRTILSAEEQKEKKISKYKNTSLLKGINLFGIYQAKDAIIKKDSVIVVEGQFDCITCHRYGFKNVVALGGAAFTKFHFFLLKRYTNNIFILLDNDLSGSKETQNIITKYADNANINPIPLPSCYKDIDEYLRKGDDHSLLYV